MCSQVASRTDADQRQPREVLTETFPARGSAETVEKTGETWNRQSPCPGCVTTTDVAPALIVRRRAAASSFAAADTLIVAGPVPCVAPSIVSHGASCFSAHAQPAAAETR